MTVYEQRKRSIHWYEGTNVPRGGDAGLYFVHHRDIDKLRYELSLFPNPASRAFLIPKIELELDKLTGFLKFYSMDVERDMELTLAEINPWLKGREIQRGRKSR